MKLIQDIKHAGRVVAKPPRVEHLLYLRHPTVNPDDALNSPRQSFMTKCSFRMGLSILASLAWFKTGSVSGLVGSHSQLLNVPTFQRRLRIPRQQRPVLTQCPPVVKEREDSGDTSMSFLSHTPPFSPAVAPQCLKTS